MSLFDKIQSTEAIRASEVSRTRNANPVTVTVTPQRITCSFSAESLRESGINIGDVVDLTFSKDGELLLLEGSEVGLKLSSTGKNPKNASVRLTNKEGIYPDFIKKYSRTSSEDQVEMLLKLTLTEDKIEFDKENRRLACSLKRK